MTGPGALARGPAFVAALSGPRTRPPIHRLLLLLLPAIVAAMFVVPGPPAWAV